MNIKYIFKMCLAFFLAFFLVLIGFELKFQSDNPVFSHVYNVKMATYVKGSAS